MMDPQLLSLFDEVARKYHLCCDYQESLQDSMRELREKLINLEEAILTNSKTPIQDMAALLKLDYAGIQPPPKACKLCGSDFTDRDQRYSPKAWVCRNGHLLPLAMLGGGRAEDSEHRFYHHDLPEEEEKIKGWSATRCKVQLDTAMGTINCVRVSAHNGPHYCSYGQGRWWFDVQESYD